jgi:putative addiction module killer protein
MRIDHGPGCRVYFMQRDPVLVVILAGGDKRTRTADQAGPLHGDRWGA